MHPILEVMILKEFMMSGDLRTDLPSIGCLPPVGRMVHPDVGRSDKRSTHLRRIHDLELTIAVSHVIFTFFTSFSLPKQAEIPAVRGRNGRAPQTPQISEQGPYRSAF
jgi:hypothetical protein